MLAVCVTVPLYDLKSTMKKGVHDTYCVFLIGTIC